MEQKRELLTYNSYKNNHFNALIEVLIEVKIGRNISYQLLYDNQMNQMLFRSL